MILWRKQERRAFIPTTWVGAKDGEDLFAISYHVRPISRLRRSVSFRLYRLPHRGIGEYSRLAEAKAKAEELAP